MDDLIALLAKTGCLTLPIDADVSSIALASDVEERTRLWTSGKQSQVGSPQKRERSLQVLIALSWRMVGFIRLQLQQDY
jgi:hypothetical protein